MAAPGSRGNRFYRNGEPRPGSSEAGLRAAARRSRTARRAHGRPRAAARLRGRRSDDGRFAATASVAGGSESVVIRRDDGSRLSFGDWARLLAADAEFARFFNSLLAASPYDAFYWECPPTSATTLDAVPYEHKTVRSRGFAPASPSDFSEHLREPCAAGAGVAAFPNLGRDAMLVAPCDAGAAPPEDGAPHRKHPTLRER
ncbi:hypothetical protein JL720_6663 [Aureococcus anophagefferens]|nr:hypothetical protein JL720_6663 [Aureococcus anophagefferens]